MEKFKLIDSRDRNYQLHSDVSDILNNCKFGNHKIFIYGSYATQSLKYYGDFDMISFIDEKDIDYEEAYERFTKIFKYVEEKPNVYFIKIDFMIKGNKVTIDDIDEMDEEWFEDNWKLKDIEFAQMTIMIWLENKFIESTILYEFEKRKKSIEELKKENYKSLKESIDKLKKEGKYFKILKRLYSYYDLKEDDDRKKQITDILNSDLGLYYRENSILKALIEAHESLEHDSYVKKKIARELEDLGLRDIEDAKKLSKELEDEYNKEAKSLIAMFPLK